MKQKKFYGLVKDFNEMVEYFSLSKEDIKDTNEIIFCYTLDEITPVNIVLYKDQYNAYCVNYTYNKEWEPKPYLARTLAMSLITPENFKDETIRQKLKMILINIEQDPDMFNLGFQTVLESLQVIEAATRNDEETADLWKIADQTIGLFTMERLDNVQEI